MAENGVRFIPGDWNAICDICAQKYKASQLKKRWDGLMVCSHDWESRHPQDFLRAVQDRQVVPWSRPRTEDVFIPSCPYPTSGGLADIGTADCAMADYAIPLNANVSATKDQLVAPFQLIPEGGSEINHQQTDNFDING